MSIELHDYIAAYCEGELVEARFSRPDGSLEWYRARVLRRTPHSMRLRVVGSGTELTLRSWDVRTRVRKVAP